MYKFKIYTYWSDRTGYYLGTRGELTVEVFAETIAEGCEKAKALNPGYDRADYTLKAKVLSAEEVNPYATDPVDEANSRANTAPKSKLANPAPGRTGE